MKKIVFLILLFYSKIAFAGAFFCEIKDSKTKEPVSSVNVKVDDTNLYFSNEKGNVYIRNLESGQHKIVFYRIGYETKIIKINYPKQNNITVFLKAKPTEIKGMIISQSWVSDAESPVTFSNISKSVFERKNFGQDANLLVEDVPNVYSFTESGSGLGYSHIKVRGFDEKRIGIMVNGIPLNDPEDHQVYWVDIPDMGENVKNIQFQRGVGNLVNGVSAFGGSLNLETQKFDMENKSTISTVFGSYKTAKISIGVNRRIFDNYNLNTRFSLLHSDGYRVHSASNLKSAFLSLSRLGKKSTMCINMYGGYELTDASWYASPKDSLKVNHRHNPKTYPGEIDNFMQPHFEFHHTYFIKDNLKINNSLFYIYGKGYYKQLKNNRNPFEYGLTDNENTDLEVDLVRRKNVIKNQVGWVGNVNYVYKNNSLLLGTYLSAFNSNHWGEVDSVSVDTLDFYKGKKYYQYKGDKKYYTFYIREKLKLFEKFNIMLNIQNLNMQYKFKQLSVGNFNGENLNRFTVDYHFINPALGFSYAIDNDNVVYFNVAKEHREPTDDELYDTWQGPDDLGVYPLFAKVDTVYNENNQISYLNWKNPLVKPESLTDFEFGSRLKFSNIGININLFYMSFTDEIVPYGGADEDGNPIRGNADKTIHKGIEISLNTDLPYNFYLSGNFSYNDNYFKKFVMHTWDENWNTITVDFSNKKIAGFPDILAKLQLSYKLNNFYITNEINYYGKQYLDNENLEGRSIKPFSVYNLQLGYNIKKFWRIKNISINLRFNNILNKKYETAGYYDSWDGKNYLWPAAEFNFISSLKVTF